MSTKSIGLQELDKKIRERQGRYTQVQQDLEQADRAFHNLQAALVQIRGELNMLNELRHQLTEASPGKAARNLNEKPAKEA